MRGAARKKWPAFLPRIFWVSARTTVDAMPKRNFNNPAPVEAPSQRPSKAGWRVGEWSGDTGCSRSYTYELLAAKRIRFVKLGTMTIIVTPPAEFLASLGAEQ